MAGTRPSMQEIKNRRSAMHELIVDKGEISAYTLCCEIDGSQPWTVREDLRAIETEYRDIKVEKKGKFLMACYVPGTPASQLEATIEELQKKNAELSEELEKKTVELQLLRKRPSDWAYEKTFLQTKVDIYERVLKAQGLITD